MMSQYVEGCLSRANDSIARLRIEGAVPIAIEISADVWGKIQFGGINMTGQLVFAELSVIICSDKEDHIQAISFNQ